MTKKRLVYFGSGLGAVLFGTLCYCSRGYLPNMETLRDLPRMLWHMMPKSMPALPSPAMKVNTPSHLMD